LATTQRFGPLRFLNVLYPGAGNQTCITRLAEVTSQQPVDLGQHDLKTYRVIQAPYDDWRYIEQRCRELARKLLVMELDGAVATEVDEFLAIADVQDLRQQDGETPDGGNGSKYLLEYIEQQACEGPVSDGRVRS
jgi:hypothetical protein